MKLLRASTLRAMSLLGLSFFPLDALSDPFQLVQQQNDVLFQVLLRERGLSEQQINAIRKIFAGSRYIGQGNPAVTQHPVTP